jgi:hypothetical protein
MSYYGPMWRRPSSSGGGGPPPPGGALTLNPWIYQKSVALNHSNCRVTFRADGIVSGDGQPDYAWLTGGSAANFDLYVALLAGENPNNALNQFIPLSVDRTYIISLGAPGWITSNLAVIIRERAVPANEVQARIDLICEATGTGGGGGGGGIDVPI